MKRDRRLAKARVAVDEGDWEAAWHGASDVVNEEWENPEALYLVGCVLRAKGHVGIAAQIFRRALAIDGRPPNLWMHYAACLHDLHLYEEAREAFLLVHKMIPGDPMPLANVAAGYIQLCKPRESIEWSDKALERDPENYIAHISRGYACLLLGRWREGWKHAEYLYGHHLRVRVYSPREREEPLWDGSPGKTLVVQSDQGLGDEIMFAQCLAQAQEDCKKVVVDCDPRLVNLMRRSFPAIDWYGTRKEHEVDWPADYQFDARVHISWLGRFYRNRDSDFTRQAYLVPNPEMQQKWRNTLASLPRPWVGLAWKGGIPVTQKHLRSVNLHDYAPIMELGGTFIDLSYHESGPEVNAWNARGGAQVLMPDLDVTDYDDTAALLSVLDRVVTVTTTAAHVCGALGRSAYVLVPKAPAWRYGLAGSDLIWYPQDSLHLFRQAPGEQDWSHAINRVAEHFRQWVVPQTAAA